MPSPFKSRLDFACEVITSSGRVQKKGEPKLGYSSHKYSYDDFVKFDPLTNITNQVTLVQWEDIFGGINHCSTICGCWIFDINFERSLSLNKESIDLVCAPKHAPLGMIAYGQVYRAIRFIPLDKNKTAFKNLIYNK